MRGSGRGTQHAPPQVAVWKVLNLTVQIVLTTLCKEGRVQRRLQFGRDRDGRESGNVITTEELSNQFVRGAAHQRSAGRDAAPGLRHLHDLSARCGGGGADSTEGGVPPHRHRPAAPQRSRCWKGGEGEWIAARECVCDDQAVERRQRLRRHAAGLPPLAHRPGARLR
ncbi:unnamed protein product, partial [Closterium sp. NIES-54]